MAPSTVSSTLWKQVRQGVLQQGCSIQACTSPCTQVAFLITAFLQLCQGKVVRLKSTLICTDFGEQCTVGGMHGGEDLAGRLTGDSWPILWVRGEDTGHLCWRRPWQHLAQCLSSWLLVLKPSPLHEPGMTPTILYQDPDGRSSPNLL